MRSANLGFRKENIVILPIYKSNLILEYSKFKSKLLEVPNIMHVTAMNDMIGRDHNTHEFRPEGTPEDEWQFYPALAVRHDFVKTFDIEIVEGRDYDEKFEKDDYKAIIINEAMVGHLGWGSNKNAIGKTFQSMLGKEKVIGVFRNFNETSLHNSIEPFVLDLIPKEYKNNAMTRYIAIRFQTDDNQKALKEVKKLWYKVVAHRPFEYFFLDKELDDQYVGEEKLGKLSGILSILVLIISNCYYLYHLNC
mgnify:FL=1